MEGRAATCYINIIFLIYCPDHRSEGRHSRVSNFKNKNMVAFANIAIGDPCAANFTSEQEQARSADRKLARILKVNFTPISQDHSSMLVGQSQRGNQ